MEKERERDWRNIPGKKGSSVLIVHGNNYLFHICHNQSGNDNNV